MKISPEKAKEIRLSFDLSQLELGSLIGVVPETISRWETGRIPIPGPISILFFILEDYPYFIQTIQGWRKQHDSKTP